MNSKVRSLYRVESPLLILLKPFGGRVGFFSLSQAASCQLLVTHLGFFVFLSGSRTIWRGGEGGGGICLLGCVTSSKVP